MWSGRWGHKVVVLNETLPRRDFSDEENANIVNTLQPRVLLLGGDDYVTDNFRKDLNRYRNKDRKVAGGKLRNDVWWTDPPIGSKKFWKVEKDGLNTGKDSVKSEMRWQQSSSGKIAPSKWPNGSDLTHMEWINCQDVFQAKMGNSDQCSKEPYDACQSDLGATNCASKVGWKADNMWSPRRGHGAVVVKNKVYVIGGRAEESVNMGQSSSLGGILAENRKHFKTGHYEVLLKNDVWVSEDDFGEEWRLLNPGCNQHQNDILTNSEIWQNIDKSKSNVGTSRASCETSQDCFGSSICQRIHQDAELVCVCPMFSPREHHTVVVQHRFTTTPKSYREDYIYVVGGFTNVRNQFCGDRVCDHLGGYRQALSDAWVSIDGISWVQLSPAQPSSGMSPRGGHASILVHDDSFGRDILWVFGGENRVENSTRVQYLSDSWRLNLSPTPCCNGNESCSDEDTYILSENDIGRCLPLHSDWIFGGNLPWQGRSRHSVTYEPPLSRNAFKHQVYLIGGHDDKQVFPDVWRWDFQSRWVKDFEERQWYRSSHEGVQYFGPSEDHMPLSNEGTPHQLYLSGSSSVSRLHRSLLPYRSADTDLTQFTRQKMLPLFSEDDLKQLYDEGVETISDLASADLYRVLRLRGYDVPGRRTRTITNLCEGLALAKDFLNKCTIDSDKDEYIRLLSNRAWPNDRHMTARMVWGESYFLKYLQPCNSSIECLIRSWDGCSPIRERFVVDVNGIGDVLVPNVDFKSSESLQDLHCRTLPQARYNSVSVLIDGQVALFGGQTSADLDYLLADVWIRDDSFPQTSISLRPRDGSHDSKFYFESNEEGAERFEYKIVDTVERLEVTPWIKARYGESIDISWLDDKKGGPGKGVYALYARSIDSSNNRDYRFSTKTNVHVWKYVPPIPWLKVILITIGGVILVLIIHLEYKRRKRKAALERYAIRRMRRKFKAKALSSGLGEISEQEWRALYYQNLEQEKKRRKSRRESLGLHSTEVRM